MGDMSCGNCSMNNQTLSQQDCDTNNGDISIGYGFLNIQTLSQCEDSSAFKEVGGYVENCDASSGYGSMNSHTDLQQNSLKSSTNYNDRNDTDMNTNLYNGDVISGIGLLNSHTFPQDNE